MGAFKATVPTNMVVVQLDRKPIIGTNKEFWLPFVIHAVNGRSDASGLVAIFHTDCGQFSCTFDEKFLEKARYLACDTFV